MNAWFPSWIRHVSEARVKLKMKALSLSFFDPGFAALLLLDLQGLQPTDGEIKSLQTAIALPHGQETSCPKTQQNWNANHEETFPQVTLILAKLWWIVHRFLQPPNGSLSFVVDVEGDKVGRQLSVADTMPGPKPFAKKHLNLHCKAEGRQNGGVSVLHLINHAKGHAFGCLPNNQ